jgi:hypothetical protein
MVVTSDGGFAIAIRGNVFITYWQQPSSLERLAKVREHEQQLVDRCKEGIVVLTVLAAGSANFKINTTGKEREVAAGLAKQFAPMTRAHAFVIEGSGFRLAAMRAAIAGINALARAGHPTRVFDATEPAVAWLARFASVAEPEVAQTLAEARARIS